MIEHGTRRIRILGATVHPVQAWVAAAGPEPAYGPWTTRAERVKFVLHDRDASFTAAFDAVFLPWRRVIRLVLCQGRRG